MHYCDVSFLFFLWSFSHLCKTIIVGVRRQSTNVSLLVLKMFIVPFSDGSSDVIEPKNKFFSKVFFFNKKIIRMSYSYNMSYDNERRSGLLYDLWDLKKALEYMSSLSTPHTVDYPQPTLGPTVALFLTDGRLGKSFFQSLDYLTKPPFFRSAER